MRILLDECTPRAVKNALAGHEVLTVQELGWSGTRNGKLLQKAETAGFAVMVTCDKNIEDQQDLRGYNLAIVALPTNKVAALRLLTDKIKQAVANAKPGQIYTITA